MKRLRGLLPLIALLAVVALCLTAATLLLRPAESETEAKLHAAEAMQRCLDAIAAEKQARGIPINTANDINHAGIIGDEFTGMTTTLGSLEAKRTAATPDAAAMVVEMLLRFDLPEGARLAVNMSGSFPGLNIAAACAIDALGLDAVYIASAGASTYGANQLELTYIDMHTFLWEQGLITKPLRAASVGGSYDTGVDMWEPDAPEIIRADIAAHGIELINEPDYAKNITQRIALYEENGPIAAYINIGGNWVGGHGEDAIVPSGIVDPDTLPLADNAEGLLARFLRQSIPCINLLNVKGLALEYGIPFDPQPPPAIGQAAIYRTDTSSRLPLWGLVAVCVVAAFFFGKKLKTPKEGSPEGRRSFGRGLGGQRPPTSPPPAP